MSGVIQTDDGANEDEPAVTVGPRPLCPASWGHAKGYISIRDPFDGTVHEIPYPQATKVWQSDIRKLMKNRG